MEEENRENTNTMNSNKTRAQKTKIIFFASLGALAVLIFVIGFFIGSRFSTGQTTTQDTVQLPPTVNTDPRALLDPIEILKSPVFTEWNGGVEGTVIAKEEESFTIEKNGRQLTIYLQESLTGFYKEVEGSSAFPEQITFEEVEVGDTVRGGVTITRGSMDNDPTHHVFANVFTVVNNAQSN